MQAYASDESTNTPWSCTVYAGVPSVVLKFKKKIKIRIVGGGVQAGSTRHVGH
jgi:hypothetical protein